MPPPLPDATVDQLATTLESLEEAPRYRDWILRLLDDGLQAPILEIGAGTGTFTEVLVDRGAVTAVEPASVLADALRSRMTDRQECTVVKGMLDDVPDDQFNSAVMVNVLEHIDDDEGTVAELARRLPVGGTLALWVPAFPMLYGPFDRELGHFRRYRRQPLIDLVTRNGFVVEDCRHANFPGWFAWLIVVRLLRSIPTGGRSLRLFDRIVPVIQRVESVVRPPFGQSLVVIARRR